MFYIKLKVKKSENIFLPCGNLRITRINPVFWRKIRPDLMQLSARNPDFKNKSVKNPGSFIEPGPTTKKPHSSGLDQCYMAESLMDVHYRLTILSEVFNIICIANAVLPRCFALAASPTS